MAANQGSAGDRRGKIVGDGDSEVEAAGGKRSVHRTKLDRAAHETHARRFALEKAEQARQEPFVGGIGEAESEGAIGRLGIEARGQEGSLDDGVEVRASFGDQSCASLREHDAAPMAITIDPPIADFKRPSAAPTADCVR